MKPFPFVHVSGEDPETLCQQALEGLGTVPRHGALGFAYASDTLADHLGTIIHCLRAETGIAHWVGTVGMGVCSTGREVYEEPSLAVMVTDVGEEALCIIPSTSADFGEFLATTASWRTTSDARFAVVHGDPSNPQTPRLIEDLARGLDEGFLVGGLTSSNSIQAQAADTVVQGGLSGVLLGAGVPVVTGLSQGCSLIGHPHEITETDRHVIHSLDGRPALDVFKEDIGEVLARNLEGVGGYIFAALPIPGSDTGDYLVRNLLGIDPELKLIAVGDHLHAGMTVQFARRDADTAREDLVRMVRTVLKRAPGPPKGALYHSCLGRGRYLFGEDSAELRLVAEELGDLPLVGFYANGEISHHRLYGYTGVLTLFC
ncbi:MAG: FIST C-terminal domain-containing protein [Pseudomonadota bacterium]